MAAQKKGIFITIEGIEGCGKSTQAVLLKRYLSRKGMDVIHTREPGGTKIGNQIRKILLDKRNKNIESHTEFFLYIASRSQHVNEIILPALQDGKVVVCDRFSDATVAYQGCGRGISRKLISYVNSFSTDGLVPDLTLVLDLPEKTGLERAKKRNKRMGVSQGEGRIEEESLLFHRKVRKGYLKIGKDNPARVKIINANKSIDEVSLKICREADRLILKKK